MRRILLGVGLAIVVLVGCQTHTVEQPAPTVPANVPAPVPAPAPEPTTETKEVILEQNAAATGDKNGPVCIRDHQEV